MTIYVKTENGNKLSLIQYCRKKGLGYASIQSRMSRGMTLQQAEEAYIKYKNRDILMYKGQSFFSYCRKNDLDYIFIMATYYRVKDKILFEDFVEDYIKSDAYKNRGKTRAKYFYKGEPLRQFCMRNHLDYNKINMAYIRWNFRNKKKKKSCTMEEIVDMAIKEKWYNKPENYPENYSENYPENY